MTTEADLLILGVPVWTGDPARPAVSRRHWRSRDGR